MRVRIGAATARGLEVTGSDYNVSDTELPGFHIRVTRNGAKTYRYRYQRADRSQAVVTLGATTVLTAEQARRKATELAAQRSLGGDPAAARDEARETEARAREHTFAALAEDFLRSKARAVAQGSLREVTRANYERRMRGQLLPIFRERTAAEITRAQVRQAIEAITAEATGNRGGGQAGAAALTLLKMLFEWAVREERLMVNPARTVRAEARPNTRERALSEEEWRGLYGLLMSAEGRARAGVSEPMAIAVLLCAFTLARRKTMAGLCRAEISADGATWTVPAGRMKSGRQFVIPLSEQAQALLRRAAEISAPLSERYVFPSPRGDRPVQETAITRAMSRAMATLGYRSAGPHDLRRTGRTLLTGERLNVALEVAERCLDHAVGGALGRAYDLNAYLAPKRRAFEALGAELERIATGEEPPGTSETHAEADRVLSGV